MLNSCFSLWDPISVDTLSRWSLFLLVTKIILFHSKNMFHEVKVCGSRRSYDLLLANVMDHENNLSRLQKPNPSSSKVWKAILLNHSLNIKKIKELELIQIWSSNKKTCVFFYIREKRGQRNQSWDDSFLFDPVLEAYLKGITVSFPAFSIFILPIHLFTWRFSVVLISQLSNLFVLAVWLFKAWKSRKGV